MSLSPVVRMLLHLVAFLVVSVVWVLLLGVLTVVALLATGATVDDLTDPAVLLNLGGAVVGALTVVQITGLALAAVGFAAGLPSGDAPDDGAARRRRTFLLAVPAWPWLAAAGAAGLVSWTLSSWIAQQVSSAEPSTPELLVELVRSGPLLDRLVVVLTIAVSAPLFEEIVFRGYLWRVVALGGGRWAAWLVTTALFCAYHLDKVQSLSIVPVALLIGWMRLRTGSLVAPILVHFANNAVSLALTFVLPDDVLVSLPVGLVGPGLAVVACGLAEVAARRRGVTTPG
ncbi:MAG: CPBP family intramembrane glutamic endopeptidase [Myxococcota bacterium]